MSSKVCFVVLFALLQVCFAASSSAAVSAAAASSAAVSSCAVASSSAAVSSLPKVCFAVSSSVVSSCAVASSSAAVSSCAVASSSAVASLALWKNRATTLAGWRTISLSKSTSFSCETMFFVFVSFATNPKRYFSKKANTADPTVAFLLES